MNSDIGPKSARKPAVTSTSSQSDQLYASVVKKVKKDKVNEFIEDGNNTEGQNNSGFYEEIQQNSAEGIYSEPIFWEFKWTSLIYVY